MRHEIKGFSLIELIMVIVIIGVISSVVSRILMESFKTFVVSQNVSEVDWQGLLIEETFENDVQSIRSNNDVLTITSHTFSFINTAGSTITYSVSGNTLTRNNIVLATTLQSFAFSYYDKNYTATTTALDVRYVAISSTLINGNLSRLFTAMAGTRGMT
jgi:prepilin-type N-terminal cleavage/methylation domain-containing protein